MAVVTFSDEETIAIPQNVIDFRSFRSWFRSREFPVTKGRVEFIEGQVWLDMAREQIFTHNQVKTEYTSVLRSLARAEQRGRFFQNGVQIVNEFSGLSCQSDGTFVSKDSLASGRVKLLRNKKGGCLELVGSPDMTLEVVRRSSVRKDYVTMREQYWLADVQEYWLVDARKDPLVFEIYRHTPKGYVATRKHDGWMKSKVFGKSFRFTRDLDELSDPEYTLEVR